MERETRVFDRLPAEIAAVTSGQGMIFTEDGGLFDRATHKQGRALSGKDDGDGMDLMDAKRVTLAFYL